MKNKFLQNFVLLLLLFLFPLATAQKQITLEDIFKDHIFYPEMLTGLRSMADGKHYSLLKNYFNIDKYSYESGEFIETVFSVKDIENPDFNFIDDYDFSQDETKILLITGKENIFRHSFHASYYIYDLITKRLMPLSEKGIQQLATFSPDGRMVAFVRDNNLYIKDLYSKAEKQITTDGKKNVIINGLADWVYEEEFSFTKAFSWSPDSKKIAFYRFDESRVKEYNITQYGNLYPEWHNYKYPKAGQENSIVTIHVYDLVSGETIQINTGEINDLYFPGVKWSKNPELLSIIRLNRLQNKMEVIHADVSSGDSEVVYEEENKYFISEITDNTIIYLDNNKEFLLISEQDGWKHIYLYDFDTRSIKPVTKGEFDIRDILSFDEKNTSLYFSSHEKSPLQQDIYRINTDGTRKKRLSSGKGWNEAHFSNHSKYFLLTHSSANKPNIYSLYTSGGKLLKVLESNTTLNNTIKNYGFQTKEFFHFNTTYGVKLNAYMIKPAGFDKNQKYPVFMFVYGGPGSQSVNEMYSFRDTWFQMLAQKGYLVVCVDNRGTDNRGEEFRKSTYMQLGKYETEDQMEAALYLKSLPYVDSARIGIYGWSYGGYMSLLCLFKGADLFKMAISVAPITNWRFYDTIYTERFMRTPQENPTGYDENSPIHHVEKMKGNLLLIHGMADDNVHLQNSAELIEKLVQENKQFELMFYPNKNHGIYGGNTTFHLYKKMTEFILENL